MPNRIKVIHFISALQNGGVEQVLSNYTGLLNKNFDIDEIIVYQHQADKSKLADMKQKGNVLYRIPYKKTHPVKNLVVTYKIIKKEQPDIVHSHMNLLNFFPLFIATILGVKVRIAHSHIAQNNINPKIEKISKKLSLKFANHYIACGDLAGRYMFGKNKFDILYNAIDQKKFKFNVNKRNKVRKSLNIDDRDIVLGNIGRFTQQKNQIFLITLFNKMREKSSNIKLIIIGEGPLITSLKQSISNSPYRKDIFLLPSTKNVDYYYNAFDYFLLPSIYEGLPLVAVESQASGVNTILSDKIDKSVKYNTNVKFASINDINNWISIINKMNPKSRCRIETANPYNIHVQFKKLYTLYKRYIKNEQ